MRAIYAADTEAVVALAAAATAKTIFGVKGDAGHGIDLLKWWFNFDGVTAAEKPILVELCELTWATNAPGTNSTAVTVDQAAGPTLAETFAAARNWTTEPTVLTPIETFELDPYKGFYSYDFPLGDSPDSLVAEGFCVRMTIPTGGAAVNARAGMRWARV
jgi:hypothetical protein